MSILVTGVAGFIGFHVTLKLLKEGETVVGIDNLSPYYDVNLKKARLAVLEAYPEFSFTHIDISNNTAMQELSASLSQTRQIIHLAAQASVQYSLTNPHAYIDANVTGHLNILEVARHLPLLEHVVYASSSSVYGANTKLPFVTLDRVDTPLSLYAVTKRTGELMSFCYHHLYNIPMTGLRFFTVYGPWGRPDMAAFLFTKAIIEETPLSLFNYGTMRRNFTYIDDVVKGVCTAMRHPSQEAKLYNIGNDKAEDLLTFVSVIEKAVGKKAYIEKKPLLPGDVPETVADIAETKKDLGFSPKTNIEEGLPRFVAWYREFYRV